LRELKLVADMDLVDDLIVSELIKKDAVQKWNGKFEVDFFYPGRSIVDI